MDPSHIMFYGPMKCEFIWNARIPKIIRFILAFVICIAWIPFFTILVIPMILWELWRRL